MSRAGARRIRLLESPWATADPVEEYILQANWEPATIFNSAPAASSSRTPTSWATPRSYTRMTVPMAAIMFPAFDLNHSYADCDVFVSIAKMKEHATAGITLSMKNCFGITPCTIYGAWRRHGRTLAAAQRRTHHRPCRQPPAVEERALGTASEFAARRHLPRSAHHRRSGVRAPASTWPIVDGIRTMTGGEGRGSGSRSRASRPA